MTIQLIPSPNSPAQETAVIPLANTPLLGATSQTDRLIQAVTNSLTSPNSRRAYDKALRDFLAWLHAAGYSTFSKASVNAYRAKLVSDGLSPSTINLKLCAIRKLVTEASDNGLLDPILAAGISRVKGVKQQGRRAGNWLNKEEATRLIQTPIRLARTEEMSQLKALRDRAILAVTIGAGLRRFEVAKLTFHHIQQRNGRWAIVDLVGKGGRIRSIGIQPWVKVTIDAWATAASLTTDHIFRALNKGNPATLAGTVKTKGGSLTDGNLTPQAIYNIIQEHTIAAGFVNADGKPTLAAHDLRRTAANLALKGGASIRQIQQMLGHASIQTTERYLEPLRSLHETAADFIRIDLNP